MKRKGARRLAVVLAVFAALIITLAGLQLGTNYLVGIEQGVHAGFEAALLTWVAFVVSLLANLGLIVIFAIGKREEPLSKLVSEYKRQLLLVLGILVALFLFFQFGTSTLLYIELGIIQGNVPPVLIGAAPALSIFAMVGILAYIWVYRPRVTVVHVDGGTHSIKAQEVTGSNTAEKSVVSEVNRVASHAGVSEEDMAKIGTILSPEDMAALMLPAKSDSGEFSRDEIQTRKNIAQWILQSLKGGVRMAKSKLEVDFERQFPNSYIPLLNSVLYDLVYQEKVEMTREGARTMLSLPRQTRQNKETEQKKQ
jgi:hypothetical protein